MIEWAKGRRHRTRVIIDDTGRAASVKNRRYQKPRLLCFVLSENLSASPKAEPRRDAFVASDNQYTAARSHFSVIWSSLFAGFM